MFVLLSGTEDAAALRAIDEMATLLRGCRAARISLDARRRHAAAATTAGTLPEDASDEQPLVDDDMVFVCRARVDNRAEILAALGGVPALKGPPDSYADSTLLRAAYRLWGVECVHRVTGDFAFAAWHPHRSELIAAVDHGGAARLYWARVGAGFAVSGELAVLLAHPQVSNAVDYASLARMLDAGLDRSSTPYLAIRALPGGHWLSWRAGSVTVKRWWNPETRPLTKFQDPSDYSAHAMELFQRAVAAQSRSAGGVSTTLSGGLDSGLVTALAARQHAVDGRQITAYTSVPELGLPCASRRNWEADDGAYASEVAALFPNVRHIFVRPDGRSSVDVMPDLFNIGRAPIKSISNLLWLESISRVAVAAGSPVILNGGAGNATISASGAGATAELFASRRFRAAFEHARAVAAHARRPLWWMLAAHAKRGALAYVDRHRYSLSVAFVRPEMRPSLEARQGAFSERGNMRARWLAFATTPRSIWSADFLSRLGADWRDPTGDRPLVEALLGFPLAAFAPGGVVRGMARTMGLGLLPESVRLRRTRGSQAPELAALIARDSTRYASMLDAMISSDTCTTLLDVPSLRTALDRIVHGDLDLARASTFVRGFGVGHFLLSVGRTI